MTTIATYVAKLGISVDTAQLNKVDKYLKRIEAKLKKHNKLTQGLTFDISRFSIDQKKLNMALGNALDIASKAVIFEISRFAIDQRALNAAVGRGVAQASRMSRVKINSTGTHQSLHPSRLPSGRGERALSSRHIAGAGAAGGIASRFWGPAIALGAGGYGLGQLNQRNQQVVGAQLQSQAVVQQAGGTAMQGTDSFNWLKAQGNRIGFNYLDAAPDYNKLLSGLTGAGMSVSQGQGVFQGFSELSRVNKLDRVAQQRVFRALSQVAGKGKLQSEELECRLAS